MAARMQINYPINQLTEVFTMHKLEETKATIVYLVYNIGHRRAFSFCDINQCLWTLLAAIDASFYATCLNIVKKCNCAWC